MRQVGRIREPHERQPARVAHPADVRTEAPGCGILPVVRVRDPGL